MSDSIDAYIGTFPPEFGAALRALRARLCAMLPDCVETISYAMPGLRQAQPKGKMVIGYGGFAKHIGVYPHSGAIICQIDCAPYKTSKSGFVFAPHRPPPDALLRAIIDARLAEIAARQGRR